MIAPSVGAVLGKEARPEASWVVVVTAVQLFPERRSNATVRPDRAG